MCVLAIAWLADPRWRLVVAANRDEYHDRPADPLHRWSDHPVIAGRDRRAGGAWLAVSEHGRFAAVTNLRGHGAPVPGRASRGDLVVAMAGGDDGPGAVGDLDDFNPFNAVSIAGTEAMFLTNRPTPVSRPLTPGFHALSNGPPDPPWRKTVRLTAVIAAWLASTDHATERLFAGLRDAQPPSGGAEDPAAIFVRDAVYGTRCSTLVLVDRDGAGAILERRYDPAGEVAGDTAIRFAWP